MENVALKVRLWEAGPASHLGRSRGLALVVGKQKGWSNGVGMGEQRARAQSLTWSKGEPALGTGKLTDWPTQLAPDPNILPIWELLDGVKGQALGIHSFRIPP